MMSIIFKKVNTLVTIQDRGRPGYQEQGVPVCGAMDEESMIQANGLVGNNEWAACIEIASGGLELLLTEGSTIALSGGGVEVTCGGRWVPYNKRIYVPANSILTCKPNQAGVWTYLAIAGSLQINPVLHSKSTYLPAGLGGFDGKKIKAGDQIMIDQSIAYDSDYQEYKEDTWGITLIRNTTPIRLVKGPEFERLDNPSRIAFMSQEFSVSADSNRMGYRLMGPSLTFSSQAELISTAVTRGTIQVTHDGTLIILMADAQTIGGYPRIAQVAAVDIPRLSQKRPGEWVQFSFISDDDACSLFLAREQERKKLAASIRLKIKPHAS